MVIMILLDSSVQQVVGLDIVKKKKIYIYIYINNYINTKENV